MLLPRAVVPKHGRRGVLMDILGLPKHLHNPTKSFRKIVEDHCLLQTASLIYALYRFRGSMTELGLTPV